MQLTDVPQADSEIWFQTHNKQTEQIKKRHRCAPEARRSQQPGTVREAMAEREKVPSVTQ